MVTLSMILLGVVNYVFTWIANRFNLPDIPLPSGSVVKSGLYLSAIFAALIGLVIVGFKATFPELYANIEATMAASFVAAQAIYAFLNAFQPKN